MISERRFYVSEGYGCAFGGGTIINAVASWHGAAFGVNLKTYSKVILFSRNKNHNEGHRRVSGHICSSKYSDRKNYSECSETRLIETCVSKTLDFFNLPYSAVVKTVSEIPQAAGLKSSTAAAHASIMATLDAAGKTLSEDEIIRIGVNASLETGVSVTGAFDDACASMYGGLCFTDNKSKTLLKQVPFSRPILIFIRSKKTYSGRISQKSCESIASNVQKAFDEALSGQIEEAMIQNSILYCRALGYDPRLTQEGIRIGVAVGLSGTGPSFICLLPEREHRCKTISTHQAIQRLTDVWSSMYPDGRIILTEAHDESSLKASANLSEKIKYMRRFSCHSDYT